MGVFVGIRGISSQAQRLHALERGSRVGEIAQPPRMYESMRALDASPAHQIEAFNRLHE